MALAEIAEEFGEPIDSVIQWESGEVAPPDRVLRSLAVIANFSATTVKRFDGDTTAKVAERSPSAQHSTSRLRKAQLGQFMTPPRIAEFMASLFEIPSDGVVRILDAGAGEGALISASVNRIPETVSIKSAAFEIDHAILPKLRETIKAINRRRNADCELVEGDFIERAAGWVCDGKGIRFNRAILNPPYKKIASNSAHRAFLRQTGLETVNLYSGFVGLALDLLETGGELVAIIPRSFCNGPYYQPFRRSILGKSAIQHIHLFGARNKAFKNDAVLQENVIIKLVRGARQGQVSVSSSSDDSFEDFSQEQHDFSNIVHPDDSGQFIRIPTNHKRQLLDNRAFGQSLEEIGLAVSTGPVVDFRVRENLSFKPEPGDVPFLYPGHFGPDGLVWPKIGFKKPNAIRDAPTTRKLLYPNGFYAVVRRFSSKEERRRIVASVIDPARLPAAMIGIENHLNVFHINRRPISEALARGLAVYLNSTAVDCFFRDFNGHTQVNASDLRSIRYPSRAALEGLGSWALDQKRPLSQSQIDRQVDGL